MRRSKPGDSDGQRAGGGRKSLELDLGALADPSHAQFQSEWDRFFEAYHSRLMSFFEYSVPDFDDRDELVQQIFDRAYRAVAISGHPLKSSSAAWTWLGTIGKNLLRDGYDHAVATERATDSHQRLSAVEDELRQAGDDILSRIAGAEGYEDGEWPVGRDVFAERLARLSDEDRLILKLRFLEDLRWAEVADHIGLSADAVRKRFSRAATFLRTGEPSQS